MLRWCDRVVTLKGPPSSISSLVLLLVLISRIPQNELRVPMNASEHLRINYNSVSMSKNAIGFY